MNMTFIQSQAKAMQSTPTGKANTIHDVKFTPWSVPKILKKVANNFKDIRFSASWFWMISGQVTSFQTFLVSLGQVHSYFSRRL